MADGPDVAGLFQPLLDQGRQGPAMLPNSVAALVPAPIAVAVLSLPDCGDRRQRLLQRGLPATWVVRYWPADDRRHMRPDKQATVFDKDAAWRRYRRLWRGSELGCALSHRSALRAFLAGSSRLLLVLEDDVIPTTESIETALNQLVRPMLQARPQPLLCHLGPRPEHLDPADLRSLRLHVPGHPRFSLRVHQNRNRPLWRAHAYLISREAARRCLALEPAGVSLLADDWQARRQAGALGLLLVADPPLFRQDDATASTQQEPIPASASPPLRSLWQRLGQGMQYRGLAVADQVLRRFPYTLR